MDILRETPCSNCYVMATLCLCKHFGDIKSCNLGGKKKLSLTEKSAYGKIGFIYEVSVQKCECIFRGNDSRKQNPIQPLHKLLTGLIKWKLCSSPVYLILQFPALHVSFTALHFTAACKINAKSWYKCTIFYSQDNSFNVKKNRNKLKTSKCQYINILCALPLT